MSDNCKCTGIDCMDKNNCRRFLEPSGIYQSWCDFDVIRTKEKCDYFVYTQHTAKITKDGKNICNI